MQKLSKGEIGRGILMVLAGTTLIVTVAAVPNLALAMKLLPRSVRKRFIMQSLRRMQNKGFVHLQGNGNQKKISLTEKGKRQAELETLALPPHKQKLSGEGWFMVSFDIPEPHRVARRALVIKLQELGFVQFQKSSYVYPRSCAKEIDFIRNYFGVRKYIDYFSVLHFEPEEESRLRKHFNIKK